MLVLNNHMFVFKLGLVLNLSCSILAHFQLYQLYYFQRSYLFVKDDWTRHMMETRHILIDYHRIYVQVTWRREYRHYPKEG